MHDHIVEQLSLELFTPTPFPALCRINHYDHVSIHPNRRMRNNWYVRIHRHSGERELHIPSVFEHAPDSVKLALLEWAHLPSARNQEKKRALRERRSHLEALIREYLHRHFPPRSTSASALKWPTKGARYDLQEVFSSINSRYFNGALESFLRWGNGATKTSFQRTRRNADEAPWHIITIAGVYNHPDVPRFAIEAIMYHEMLHIHIPPRSVNGRTVMHGADFKKMERSFPWYTQWARWERCDLPRLLTEMKRKERTKRGSKKLLFF